MENNMLSQLKVDENTIDSVKLVKRTAGVKGLVVGASLVGACWLGVRLYKNLKKHTCEEVEPETQTESDMIH